MFIRISALMSSLILFCLMPVFADEGKLTAILPTNVPVKTCQDKIGLTLKTAISTFSQIAYPGIDLRQKSEQVSSEHVIPTLIKPTSACLTVGTYVWSLDALQWKALTTGAFFIDKSLNENLPVSSQLLKLLSLTERIKAPCYSGEVPGNYIDKIKETFSEILKTLNELNSACN